ncbi:Maturation and nuclear export of 40S ribosomal subunits interacting protein [Friedmanniomyces endolithicus]|nr:Maturation and nuclear export of 40S ribosomal subunits interacting protein [Friedmanniomyces endolithicus]KAK1815609.1 Maturation and nuclear export of 40S ribosomal subunits interacting protein [Friedmanniomyces endolithicus]
MPGIVTNGAARKRKRDDAPKMDGTKPRKAPKTTSTGQSTQTRILHLEEQILQGREHYNNIVELQSLVKRYETKPRTATLAAVGLCRVFCRLIAAEALVKTGSATDGHVQIVQWLKGRLREYVESLLIWIGSPEAAQESTSLTLLMRIVKAETSQGSKRSEQAWRTETSTFLKLIRAFLERTDAEGARQEFGEKYADEYDDVRFYTFLAVKQVLKTSSADSEEIVGGAVDLLSHMESPPDSDYQPQTWYSADPPSSAPSNPLLSLATHRKAAQETWLAIFRSLLTKDNRKRLLTLATSHILPNFFTRLELLADFLTDSFNAGGSLSLLALNSIFHLITHQNLDYPEFYTKLYSLLDEDILHSKYRSRFFRLLEIFLRSEHLPAALVASFVKRLARLSLQAPPGAIVWIVPWVYNCVKEHPSLGFLLHRPHHPAHRIYSAQSEPGSDSAAIGVKDPFDMLESNPNTTGAIDSSLWELETLQSHYHPNVATLARILGEQFTKREYVLEDFLDHSYATLVGQELGREVSAKKGVEVEWAISKRIVMEEVGEGLELNGVGRLLTGALEVM